MDLKARVAGHHHQTHHQAKEARAQEQDQAAGQLTDKKKK